MSGTYRRQIGNMILEFKIEIKMKNVIKMILKLKIDVRKLIILLEYFFIKKSDRKKCDDKFFDDDLNNDRSWRE
ncbi:MAG: hypothetical protein COC01_10055 [Bacteroidetes bacterium]|nr:MAG: hypothetical protein COC01_10055 [Bacteroidota bacterium]